MHWTQKQQCLSSGMTESLPLPQHELTSPFTSIDAKETKTVCVDQFCEHVIYVYKLIVTH